MGQEDGEGGWRLSTAGAARSRAGEGGCRGEQTLHTRTGGSKVELPQTSAQDPGPELAALNFSSPL